MFVLKHASCVPGGPFEADYPVGPFATATRTFSEHWTRADAEGAKVCTFSTVTTPSSDAADESSTPTSSPALVTSSTSATTTWPAVAAVAEALSRWSATASR